MKLKGSIKKDWWKGIVVFILTVLAIIAIGFAIKYFNGGF